MTEFEQIAIEIKAGLEGRNHSISIGFNKLNKYIGIRKKIMTLVFGSTGSGKTSMVHSAFILSPFDWYLQNKHTTKIKMKVILFSFERSKIYIKTKWLIRKIYLDTGVLIPIEKMLGWWENSKLTHDEHDLVSSYSDYINELCEFVTIIEGSDNPTGPYKYIKKYAEEHGKVNQISEHQKIYIPNNDNLITVPIIDHMGLFKLERDYKTKKEAIDKACEYSQIWRDLYGFSPVWVAQITRELGSAAWQKIGEFEPTIDQIKESGSPGEASDVILSLFDPLRYNTTTPGYDASKFRNSITGECHFRSIKILKNTYGTDSIRCGTVFQGSTGIFSELPKRDQITDELYEEILNGNYFRNEEKPVKSVNFNKKQ